MFHPSRPDGSWYFHDPHGQGCNAVGYEITVDSYPPFETSELDEVMHDLDNKSLPNSCRNEFRVVPDEARLTPFLEGFARIAARVYSLKRAIIWSPTYWDPEWDDEEAQDYDNVFYRQRPYWCIQYSDQDNGVWGSLLPYPISPSEDKKYDPAMRCLIWVVSEWRPDTELRNLFQNIGREKHGNNLVEHWEESYDTSTPSGRRGWMLDDYYDDPGRIRPSSSYDEDYETST